MSKNLPFSTQHNQFTNSTRPSIILRKVIIILRIDWVTNLIDSLVLVSITVFWKIDCTDFFGCTIITPYLILRWAIIIPKIVQLNHFFFAAFDICRTFRLTRFFFRCTIRMKRTCESAIFVKQEKSLLSRGYCRNYLKI